MPRPFRSEEKEAIRSALLRAGRDLFGRHGLRRTTIQELTRAAGIAQGSFYGFYPSKEDLFFEILEIEEAEFFGSLARDLQSKRLGRKRLKAILVSGFHRFRAHPFLGNLFASGEYEHLRRSIPEPRMRRHVEGEIGLVAEVMGSLRKEGRSRSVDPKLIVALLQALFLLFVHEEQFDPEVFPGMIDLVSGLVADHLATTGARNLPA
jgi:AcrR family transcriptional regulator